jgi:hypothetical protein
MSSNGSTDNKSIEIDNIFKRNTVEDLEKFIKCRSCLNNCNTCFSYLFHFLQISSILTTTISASYNYKELLWIGIGLNAAGSLVSVYEKINIKISDNLLENIKKIKNGDYVDESHIIKIDEIVTKNLKTINH